MGERLELLDGVLGRSGASGQPPRRHRHARRAGLREYWIVNLVERVLEVHREPQPATDAANDWSYRSVDILRPPLHVTPLAAPSARILIADLLP